MSLRVAHVTSATNMIYGAVHSMMTLAEAQKDRGYDVQFVTFKGKPFVEDLRRLGWENTAFSVRTKVDPIAVAQMAKHFKKNKIDVVHTHLSTSSINGCLAARLAKIPCVATVHGMSGKLSFIFADHMIGVSEGVRQHLIGQGIKQDRVTAVYNGVEVPSDLLSKSESRLRFGIPDDAFVFGTVSRLTPLKGIEYSIRAFAEIQGKVANSLYVLVGDGDGLTEYQELASTLGIQDKVKFLGYQAKVFEPLAAMDMFLFPSLKEAMGISVVEALAVGLPVVSTNVGGLPEVVTSDVGSLVEPRDAEAMASEAIAIANGNRQRLAENAKQRAQDLFSVESMFTQTQAVYHRLLKS